MSAKPRLVYDGVCNLCAEAVRFLNAIDHKHAVDYTPYQNLSSDETRSYGLSAADLQGRMHIIRCNGTVVRGAAVLAEACKLLAPITLICELLNNPLSQRFYDFIARRRYRLFGCRGSCYVPAVDRADR